MQIAETAKRLGHVAFGADPFVAMAPVITLGSLSKRWLVPGWRLGWLVTSDPHGNILKSPKVEIHLAKEESSR
ncbi:hypothetical protein SASPL_139282 [Salvia splendens]|uniref:Aminotransferase class I/classII large domain-containing protein n=1 Tax=Salvia splendens TaxID=180675 RepID=A0A8X8WPE7_SALSN|nr:hypothetical protein SASPL_139282 [Salvia splendens]